MTGQVNDDTNIYVKEFFDRVTGSRGDDVAFSISNLVVSVGMIVAMIGLPPVPKLFPEEKGNNADVFIKYVRRAVTERAADISPRRPGTVQVSEATVTLFEEMVKSFIRATTK